MKRSTLLAAAMLSIGFVSHPATAQDAAESAMILSGTGQQGAAQRSLGSAITQSINNASNSINARRAQRNPRSVQSRNAHRQARRGYIIGANVDALEGTDAATYRTGNGSVIRVSGRLNPSADTNCVKNCP